MLTSVDDYLAKVDIDKILYINKIPLDKVIPRDIPVLNPLTSAYKKFWVDGEARKCIEGFWVEHKGLWKFVPGVIYHYGAHWHILLSDKGGISKTKKKARPLIRDLEWIKGFLYLEARGFSGFADDEEYTCHREVSLPEEKRTVEFIGKNCYNSEGKLKKYIPAKEYLWAYHSRNLGKALFENMAQNVVDLEARGCLAKGTKVRMFDGTVKCAEDIVQGDLLMGKDSTARTVEWIHSGISPMFKVSSRRFDDIIVNENHILSVKYRYKPKKLKIYLDEERNYSIQDLYNKQQTQSTGSFKARFRRYLSAAIKYREDSKEFNPYMVGYWLADGRSNTISIKSTDKSILSNLNCGNRRHAMVSQGTLKNRKTAYELRWLKSENGDMYEIFRLMLYNKHIPQNYKTASIQQRLELLAGIVDGDGCYDKKCNSFDVYCGLSKQMAEDCVEIVRSVGLYADLDIRHRENYKTTYEVLISGDIHIVPTKYERKQAKKVIRRIDVTNDSFTIAPNGIGEYFGFKLDGDNEYLLADYTVDHNTGKSYIMSNFAGVNFTFDGAQDFDEWWNARKTANQLASEVVIGAIDAKYVNDLTKKLKLGLESYEGKFTIGTKSYPAPFTKAYSGQWIPGQTIEQVVEVKRGGQWEKKGSRSKVQPRTFGDNEFAANGTRPGFSIIDEVGFMYNLLETLVQMKECTADGADKFGTIWMTGTGGDMSGGATQAVMGVFFDPKTYDCVEFEDSYENSGNKIGFFVPAWMGLNQFKDDLGNTNYRSAIQYLLNAREELNKGKDRSAYDGELSQRPIYPSEVFLISGGNILPTGMLKDQLSFLQTTPDKDYEGVLGRMSMDPTGKVNFNIDIENKLQACDWPVKKGDEHTGAIQIWEQPSPNIGFGYYLAGNDPYDIDKAPNSPSLGSLIVMRRESPGISGEDMIVAEYTARPNTAVDFYEQARLLLIYYGIIGTCLYENERVGIQTYFTNNNSAHLLARTPSILKANQTSNVNRGIGQHMSTKVKEECEIFLRDWLIAPAGNGKLNLHNIPSKPLLKELINYNKIGNFDRVIAMMLCIIQKTQMHKIVTVAIEEEAAEDPFFSRAMFGGRVAGSRGFIGF